ncbi:MAG: AMP-binding protein [Vicinamibacterales bacterium]
MRRYLAILARGAVAVPFSTPTTRPLRWPFCCATRARALLGRRLQEVGAAALASLPDVHVLDVHADADDVSTRPQAHLAEPAPVDAASPAVILYTSGTTSDPKGVVLTHANLLAERDAAFQVVDVGAEDSVLGVLPLFHSLAQLANLLLPFAVGARVVYLETLGSQELVRALSERRITIFACVPQFFYLIHERILREAGRKGALARAAFRGLLRANTGLRRLGLNAGPLFFGPVHRIMGRQMRLFITGGSKFDPAVGRDLYALGFTILQAYGLTETSGAATINRPEEASLDTVGRPLPGVEIRIEPPGDEGEVAIRGPIVMQGYFNRPDATAAVMQDGWFLTGDLGRLDAEGRLTITGRRKEVIILANGKNLYPEEIETHYRASPFVREICVTTLGSGEASADERLYAVVVPDMDVLRAKKIVNAGELLRFELEGLGASLPSYKRVLGYDVVFDPLPRTTTGKLKRHEILRRLREAHAAGARAETDAAVVDDAWSRDPHVAAALGVARRRTTGGGAFGAEANLELDLGFDSMERVELLADLEQAFGVSIPEEVAHQILTLGQLIEAVRPAAGGGTRSTAAGAEGADASWAVLLGDLPPSSDPVLGGLLASRPVVAPAISVFGRALARLLARVEVSGLEHLPRQGPFLVCPNHQSYVDGFLVASTLPYRILRDVFFVGAVEYFETPLMAWVARHINLVPVDPDSNLVPAMKAGAFGLAHGKVLMLFPEGERSIDGTVKRFKKGAPILSRHTGAPIVPVAIRGAFELWPRGHALDWRRLLPGRRAHVRIRFGPPLGVQDGESDADAATRLRAAVERMWADL